MLFKAMKPTILNRKIKVVEIEDYYIGKNPFQVLFAITALFVIALCCELSCSNEASTAFLAPVKADDLVAFFSPIEKPLLNENIKNASAAFKSITNKQANIFTSHHNGTGALPAFHRNLQRSSSQLISFLRKTGSKNVFLVSEGDGTSFALTMARELQEKQIVKQVYVVLVNPVLEKDGQRLMRSSQLQRAVQEYFAAPQLRKTKVYLVTDEEIPEEEKEFSYRATTSSHPRIVSKLEFENAFQYLLNQREKL